MFTSRFQAWVRRNAQRVAGALARSGITPNQVTIAGMLATFVAGVLAGFGFLIPAGLVLAFSGTFDILDGALARATKRMYPFGAFLDSTTDRYSEVAVYLGIAVYFLTHRSEWYPAAAVAVFAAVAGSLLVSYVRARAQSLGFRCDSGLFARPERVVATVIGLLLGPPVLDLLMFALAILTNVTVVQRINEVYVQARAARRAAERAAEAPASGETSRP